MNNLELLIVMVSVFLSLVWPFISDFPINFISFFRRAKAFGLAHVCNRSR